MEENRSDYADSKEPFFGFLEWLTVCALVSGGVASVITRLDGVIQILSLVTYGALVVLSGIWMFRQGRF